MASWMMAGILLRRYHEHYRAIEKVVIDAGACRCRFLPMIRILIRINMRIFHIVFTTLLFISSNAHAATLDEDVSRRKFEVRTIAQCAAKPVVVFENGANLTFDTWDKVIASIDTEATIFAYNRPGYGKSEATRHMRDGRTIVDELRALLRQKGLAPPYVLVGHSLGGLYMQLFARAYPREVKGLVLVDAIYPGVVKKTEDFPLYDRVLKRVFASRTVNEEIDQIQNTGNQILALPWRGEIPVVRLNTTINYLSDPDVFNSGPKLKAAIDGLYPNADTVVVNSSHRIQVTTPDAVVSAIRRVLPANAAAACRTL
jgi:hypothetical protein